MEQVRGVCAQSTLLSLFRVSAYQNGQGRSGHWRSEGSVAAAQQGDSAGRMSQNVKHNLMAPSAGQEYRICDWATGGDVRIDVAQI